MPVARAGEMPSALSPAHVVYRPRRGIVGVGVGVAVQVHIRVHDREVARLDWTRTADGAGGLDASSG